MPEQTPPDRIWKLRLLGLRWPGADVALTIMALALLAATRFAFLADGPWEQDEAVFSRSVLSFDPGMRFPHPPFYPAWMVLGFLFTPLVGEPLRAFQVISCLASIASIWPLAFLGRRVAPPAVAFACALAVQFAPGTWVHSVRAFTAVAEGLLAFLAAALLLKGARGLRFVWFSLIVVSCLLVRANFVLSLAILWLAGARAARSRKWIAMALGAGTALVLAVYVPIVIKLGGLNKMVGAVLFQAETHGEKMGNFPWTFSTFGFVAGFGGTWPTIVIAVLCLVGLAVWWRRVGRGAAATYGAMVAILVLALLFLHARTFPRYSVPLLMGVAPLLAGALGLLRPVALAAAVPLLGAGWAAVTWYPSMVEQSTTQLALWQAVEAAQARAEQANGEAQVYGVRGSWYFISYLHELRGKQQPGLKVPPPGRWLIPTTRPPLAPHWLVVTSIEEGFLPYDRSTQVASFSGGSAQLEALSQHRHFSATVTADPPLLLGKWWPAETSGSGRKFAWCSSDTGVLLPPVPPGVFLRLTLRPATGPKPLLLAVNDKLNLTVPGAAKLASYPIPAAVLFTDRVNRIAIDRDATYPPGGKDNRPLAAQVFEITTGTYKAFEVSLGEADRLTDLGIDLQGFYGKEVFRDGVVGCWSKPSAVIALSVPEGALELTLLAPRPGPTVVEVLAGGQRLAGPWQVPTTPQRYQLRIPRAAAASGTVRLELRSSVYQPLSAAGRPARELGVVVSRLSFTPAPPAPSATPAAMGKM